MKPLFLKEVRQGRPLLIFSLVVALLLAAGKAVVGRAFPGLGYERYGEINPLSVTVAMVMLATPLLLALFAGAGLFAAEADHGTVPILFALPLSRRRIWLGKVLAGLALTAIGSALFLAIGALLLPDAFRTLPIPAYLPELCLAMVSVFAAAAFVSALTPYVVASFVGTICLATALGLGLGLLWGQAGALLLGYNPATDVALWGFLVAPALLVASALAVTRGELLQSARKLLFAGPALVAGLLVTVAAVSGVARYATRYQRDRVQSISAFSASRAAAVLALTTHGDPVPLQRDEVGKGWERRPFNWEQGQMGDLVRGPLYRSSYQVVLDLHTGRELWVHRRPFGGEPEGLACSPDGRLAAAAAGPAGLTWGGRLGGRLAQRVVVVDLREGKTRYAGIPEALRRQQLFAIAELKWSAGGEHLAFMAYYSAPSGPYGLYVMRPDGSSAGALAAMPAFGQWAWSPTEEVIYALDRARLRRFHPDGRPAQALWSPGPLPEGAALSLAGISPDGRWVALVETREATRQVTKRVRGLLMEQEEGYTERLVIHLVRSDGGEHLTWSSAAGGLPEDSQQAKLAWSSEGPTLFALVGVGTDRAHQGRQLFRWQPGEPSLARVTEVEFPPDPAALLVRPESDELLIWPHPGWGQRARHGAMLVDNRGRVRPVPSAATAVQFADENRFACFDDSGRLITIAGSPPHQTVKATNLETGETNQLYP